MSPALNFGGSLWSVKQYRSSAIVVMAVWLPITKVPTNWAMDWPRSLAVHVEGKQNVMLEYLWVKLSAWDTLGSSNWAEWFIPNSWLISWRMVTTFALFPPIFCGCWISDGSTTSGLKKTLQYCPRNPPDSSGALTARHSSYRPSACRLCAHNSPRGSSPDDSCTVYI